MEAVEMIGEAQIDDDEIIGDPMIPQALPNKIDILKRFLKFSKMGFDFKLKIF